MIVLDSMSQIGLMLMLIHDAMKAYSLWTFAVMFTVIQRLPVQLLLMSPTSA
jgi:hypothetical protein